jgi:hypothetical protein
MEGWVSMGVSTSGAVLGFRNFSFRWSKGHGVVPKPINYCTFVLPYGELMLGVYEAVFAVYIYVDSKKLTVKLHI